MPEGFHSSYDVRVRFAETDAQGIAHHASFVVWLEVARVAYWAEHAGGYRAIQEQGLEALTTGLHVEYRATAAFDDVLTVFLRCVDVKGAPRARALVDGYIARLAAAEARAKARSAASRASTSRSGTHPMISAIGWVSELIELAGGQDIFATARPGQARKRPVRDRARGERARARGLRRELVRQAARSHRPCTRVKASTSCLRCARARLHELDPAIILQPGPACLTDGLSTRSSSFFGVASRAPAAARRYA